ncbi:GntR family transcriptional regulator, partial [Actinomadura logoneensis]
MKPADPAEHRSPPHRRASREDRSASRGNGASPGATPADPARDATPADPARDATPADPARDAT